MPSYASSNAPRVFHYLTHMLGLLHPFDTLVWHCCPCSSLCPNPIPPCTRVWARSNLAYLGLSWQLISLADLLSWSGSLDVRARAFADLQGGASLLYQPMLLHMPLQLP